MNVNNYIESCLAEHETSLGEIYFTIPKLTKDISETTIFYIFTNLYLNNKYLAKTF